jgi:ribosome assembly protein RRB1
MSKRAIDPNEDRAPKQARVAFEQPSAIKTQDEGMGEFEDQWDDEHESDGEVVENKAEGDDENADEDRG